MIVLLKFYLEIFNQNKLYKVFKYDFVGLWEGVKLELMYLRTWGEAVAGRGRIQGMWQLPMLVTL